MRGYRFSFEELRWQIRDDAPPACRVPTDLPEAERLRRFHLFDVAGPRRAGEADWARIREAVKVCQPCPVRDACLAYALDPAHRVEGVWGGHYFGAPEQRAGASLSVRKPTVPPPPRSKPPRRRSVA